MKKLYILFYTLLFLGIGIGKAQYKDLHDFNDTLGAYPDGDLILLGNKLYGMTLHGGVNHGGCIFSIDTMGNNFKDIFNFTNAGFYPSGHLTFAGNKFYGMVELGGVNDSGCIFSIDTNGSGFKDLFDFNGTNGMWPQASLTLSGNMFYAMTPYGGAHDYGCIFSIDTNGGRYKDLFDFASTNGGNPYGSLIIKGNILYGLTEGGGLYDSGCIFSIDTNGSGYKDIHDFNGITGAYPTGSLIFSGKRLYGMTTGTQLLNNYGNIFSIDSNGGRYTDMYDFNNSNGSVPNGSLILYGTELYGMTAFGGLWQNGCIFSIDTSGIAYNDIHDFSAPSCTPYGSLIRSGTVLYGMTSGNNCDVGNIFSFKDVDLGINKLASTTGSINIFPNPSNGYFTLSVSNVNEKCNVEIYNMIGEKVQTSSLPSPLGEGASFSYPINITFQPNGVYFYRVMKESGELVGSGKLIIQK